MLITGDRRIIEETTRLLPWAVGIAVKDPIGFSAVNSLTPQAARDAIRAGAREAMGRIAQHVLFSSSRRWSWSSKRRASNTPTSSS